MVPIAWMAIGAASLSASALAQSQDASPRGPAWSVTFENDLFFGTDQYYTDGVQIQRKDRVAAPGPKLDFSLLTGCKALGCGESAYRETRDKLGQLMYTPMHIDIARPQPYDRPWAGLLYYTRDYEYVEAGERSRTNFSLQMGIIGPHSMVEGTQKWIHKTFDGTPPEGWDNQIETELGLMAMVERRIAVPGLSTKMGSEVQLNLTRTWRVAVGNIMTFVGVGAMLEMGKGISATSSGNAEIGTKKVIPQLELQRTDLDRLAVPAHGADSDCLFSWLKCTAALSVEVRWMLRNVFLDGTMFRDGPRVDSRPIVADMVASVRLDFPRTRTACTGPLFLQFAATRRSPEFNSPRYRASSQSFGALTLGSEF